jgi:two-component system nitrogen regulation response regulator NtrX
MTGAGPAQVVLVIDDEVRVRRSLVAFLQDENFETLEAKDLASGAALLDQNSPEISLVLLDVWLPDGDGIHFLESRTDLGKTLPVIVMSGHGNIDMAVRATRLGAFDFLEKPVTPERLSVTIGRALEMARLKSERDELRGHVDAANSLVGESVVMKALRVQLARVAATGSKVLVLGENGTGKELVARLIHEHSPRRDFPFVRVNSAAIPRDLVESELFGHEKGAFTGATAARKGKMELAHKGTLFLDEIGDMSLEAQAKLLRAIESGEFERLGGSKTLSVDVRLVAATNKDLKAEMDAGRFRDDLYYRLNVVPIRVPPLRDRRDDIPLLVDCFLDRVAPGSGGPSLELTPGAMALLRNYSWPGNVRELRNVVERLAILADNPRVDQERLLMHLPELDPAAGGSNAATETAADSTSDGEGANDLGALRQAVEAAEKRTIRDCIEAAGGNMSEAARRLGIDRANLYRKIKRYNMERDFAGGR